MINFSICLIAKNEEKTLPRLFASLKNFKEKGGEIVLLDTGSSDRTAEIAEEFGCKVERAGDKFVYIISAEEAFKIEAKFNAEENQTYKNVIVKPGERLFNFSAARNYCASLASNDMIAMPDCDEVFTALELSEVNNVIEQGYTQLEFNFVYAHGPNGEETIKFLQCKFYDRRVMSWVGMVHEVLQGGATKYTIPERKYTLPERIFKVEHYQNETTNRSGYLKGLAADCYMYPQYDRNSHYFARELMWNTFYLSAIKEFERHLTLSTWDAEKAQSMTYIGDCYMYLGKPKDAIQWYLRSYIEYGGKREPLIKIAQYYYKLQDWVRVIFFLNGALQIEYSGLYIDDVEHYRDLCHGMLYMAYWYTGNIKKSKEQYDKAISYNPTNTGYLNDRKFYYSEEEYEEKGIEGWMTIEELNFLHSRAKKYLSIAEIGSWMGRSTDALLSGTKGTVTAIDHFIGSNDARDQTQVIAKKVDVYAEFISNVGHYENLHIMMMSSETAEEEVNGAIFDMVFIDAEHTYEGVKKDIALWLPHAGKLICGHDYSDIWPGVKKAVDEMFIIDGVVGTIWYKYI